MQESNIGETGIQSIRIGGMRVVDLPMVPAAAVRFQMPLVEDGQRQNRVETILASSPKQKVLYLESRIREAEANIFRVNQLKSDSQKMISEYSASISLCEHRDKEIIKIDDDDPDKSEKIKELNKQFPPYNVKAMLQQNIQSQETIDRCDDVVGQEYTSIAELRGIMGLCQKRDVDLQNLGVRIE